MNNYNFLIKKIIIRDRLRQQDILSLVSGATEYLTQTIKDVQDVQQIKNDVGILSLKKIRANKLKQF